MKEQIKLRVASRVLMSRTLPTEQSFPLPFLWKPHPKPEPQATGKAAPEGWESSRVGGTVV